MTLSLLWMFNGVKPEGKKNILPLSMTRCICTVQYDQNCMHACSWSYYTIYIYTSSHIKKQYGLFFIFGLTPLDPQSNDCIILDAKDTCSVT